MSAALIQGGQLGLGYRIADENHAMLAAGARPMGFRASKLRTWNPTKTLKLVSQGQMGSCTGHALAVLAQFLNYLKTGEIVPMSRMWCYLRAQKHSGFIGSDQGASIAGAVEAAMQDGVCREQTFPYPNPVRYSTYEPAGAASEAKPHLFRNKSVLRSYDDVAQWLGSGVGGVDLGCNWTTGLANNRTGIVEVSNMGGQTLGGHSRCFISLSDRVDSRGRHYVHNANSHGSEYGRDGWTEDSPDAVDEYARQGATMIGVTDMESYGEREYPLSGCV